jgi:hypothetical protein
LFAFPRRCCLLLPSHLVPQQTVDGLQVALEIRSRSSYVPNVTTGV